jgi:hypothetical protein
MPSREEIVERELGVKLPQDYRAFLDAYGYYEYPGGEVYGLTEEMLDVGEIPCVIGATLRARQLYNLPKGYLVINHSGFEDEVVCLDTETGHVYIVSHGSMQRTAGSFEEWFRRNVMEKS